MARQKTTLREVLVATLVFSVIVAAMTWYDIRPKAPEIPEKADLRGAFYINKGAALSNVPDNQLPLLIWEGAITEASTIDLTPISPITFPQREIGLHYDMAVVPSALSPLYDALLASIKRWEVAGNIVSDVTIRYNTDTPDWVALNAMVNGFRKLTHLSYRITLTAHPEWFKDNKDARTEIQNNQQNFSYLIFNLNDAIAKGQSTKDFIAELSLIEFPFRIIANDGTDLSAFDDAYRSTNKFFSGFISDVSSPVQKDNK